MKFSDEIEVEMISALGSSLGKMSLPLSMKEGFISTYLNSGAVKFWYLYIDGKEVTDGLNHNPFRLQPGSRS